MAMGVAGVGHEKSTSRDAVRLEEVRKTYGTGPSAVEAFGLPR